ncbi:MAG: sugar phosphate nucleotidyltransferase [Anaerolineales bacterium]|nr:sugar phosphate nucleotidyltransferase [Anaerolineales bacterium]
MTQTLKIVIPTAGWATRMRPQTWSKPKPLVSVAGKTVLDHLLDIFRSVPDLSTGSRQCPDTAEYIIILGPGLGETQIPPFMQEHYPELKTHFVLQPVMRGQSDALWLARKYLTGPVVICFSDTLMETDFSFLADEKADGVAWVKPVPDPRRFGVAEVDGEGWVTHLVEKPQAMDNNLVVVGCYYFKQAEELLSAIEEQFRRGASLRGEYFLTDTINIMIERGLKMRTQTVEVWLDTGTIDATLETNRYLLSRLQVGKLEHENLQTWKRANVTIVPPVFVHASAEISNSVIGPYASIGADCKITGARVEDSILEAGVTVDAAALKGSFIGRQARVQGRSADDPPLKLNIGDNSSVTLK